MSKFSVCRDICSFVRSSYHAYFQLCVVFNRKSDNILFSFSFHACTVRFRSLYASELPSKIMLIVCPVWVWKNHNISHTITVSMVISMISNNFINRFSLFINGKMKMRKWTSTANRKSTIEILSGYGTILSIRCLIQTKMISKIWVWTL